MRKITVEIIKQGLHNEAILSAIASNNDEKGSISLRDIAGYLRVRAAEFPGLYSKSDALFDTPDYANVGTTLRVSEDGNKTVTLIISQADVNNE